MSSPSRDQLKQELATRSAPAAPQLSAAEMRRPQPIGTIRQLIESQKAEIARALPKNMDADRLARIAFTTIRSNPDLAKCTPESLLGSVMTCAQLGLEPGPLGHAYFVPFKGEVTFILGYKGMIALAQNSGKIVSLIAREVYEHDTFDVAYGLADALVHKPQILGDRGNVVAYYAVAKLTGGGHAFVVLSRSDVEKYRKRSKQPNGPMWRDDYDAAAKKTCIRRLFTYLPASIEVAQAIAQDGQVRVELDSEALDAPQVYDDAITVDGEIVEAPEGRVVEATGEMRGSTEEPDEPAWPTTAQPGGPS